MKKKKIDIGKKSLKAHKKLGGKIATASKVTLKSLSDWSTYYTPGVGAVSTHLAKHPHDASVYTIKKNTVAVISDGSAVLGLGNIGPYGALPVMEGKAAIFKEVANVDAVPIVLDTHDQEKIIETIVHIAPAFGGINLEDIASPQCFYIEEELKKQLSIPVMHDDQHGTAIVVLAALTNALRVVKKKKETVSIVILGAGAAGSAVAKLLALAGFKDLCVVDREGALCSSTAELPLHKKILAMLPSTKSHLKTLEEVMVGADVFIGISSANAITQKMVKSMAPHSIVFALANPTPEIMPDLAKRAGAKVVATGRSDFPNQVNNALVFPGVFRGALDHHVTQITDEMKLRAAYALARMVKKPHAEHIIPSVLNPQVVKAIAKAIK
ncbi:MAG: NADP-dependent malic enzyme [Patescibacteria group bacterium]